MENTKYKNQMDTDKLNKAAQAYCDQHTGSEYTAFIAGAKWAGMEDDTQDAAEEAGDTDDELAELLAKVGDACGIGINRIRGKSRRYDAIVPRQMFCYVAWQKQKWTCRRIGSTIGRDRTTVAHSCTVVKNMLATKNPEYMTLYENFL